MIDPDSSSVVSLDTSPYRSQTNHEYNTSSSIEIMSKRKDDRKEFIVIKNDERKSSSNAWKAFGFPARFVKNGSYKYIFGFASCFQCKMTYKFNSDGTGSTKHLLRHICSKISSSTLDHTHDGSLDKLIKHKSKPQSLSSTDATKIKDEFTKWICSSVRPFNIVQDTGLRNVLQSIMDIS
jgi:hypothetical protein